MYGFVKVCAATPELKVADTRFNAEKIIEIIKGVSGVQVLVFPELSVCGYTCGDLFNQQVLVSGAEQALEKICAATRTKRTLARTKKIERSSLSSNSVPSSSAIPALRRK